MPTMTDEDKAFLHALAKELRTQDNACTAYPLFLVQQRHRIYGMDPDYGDSNFEWFSEDREYHYPDGEIQAAIREELELPTAKHLDPEYYGWEKVYYVDEWRYVSAHLTRRAAQQYIDANAHRMTDPRIYVESQYRCHEFNRVMEILRDA